MTKEHPLFLPQFSSLGSELMGVTHWQDSYLWKLCHLKALLDKTMASRAALLISSHL